MVLVVLIMMMVILLSITGASLLFSRLNLKTAASYKSASAVLHIADAGIQHALAAIPSGSDFDSLLQGSVSGFPCGDPCDGTSNKPTLTGSLSGHTYTVVAENDPADPGSPTNDTNNIAILTSTATGPNSSMRRVNVYIGRSSSWSSPGAFYLPGDPLTIGTSDFDDNDFKISGNDTNPGDDCSVTGGQFPAIATSDSGTTDEIIGASGTLSSSQYGQVTGKGGSTSVVTTPTSSYIDVNKLAEDLINAGQEGVDKQTLPPGTYSGGEWGTASHPKITHVSGNGEVRLVGDLKGYGILILDNGGDLHVAENFTWKGIIITRRHVHFNPNHFGYDPVYGGKVWGSVLIDDSSSAKIEIGGTSQVCYSSQAINTVVSPWIASFPKTVEVRAWQELMS